MKRLSLALRRVIYDPWNTPPLWGDGFADDVFGHLASVTEWDLVSSDEYLRLYPRLVGVRPSPLLDHLERAVATLFVQARRKGAKALRSIDAKRAESLASAHAARWSPRPAKIYLDGLFTEDLIILDDLFCQLMADTPPPYEAAVAEVVAFHTGIHPAYFWPEAVTTHQRFTTLGWLGVVMRGRSALMPYDVAEYLCDSLTNPDGDPNLANRMGSQSATTKYLRDASRRLRGCEVILKSCARHHRRVSFAWSAP